MIWTRVTTETSDPIAVRWEVALDEGFDCIVAAGSEVASFGADFTVKVDVAGLGASTRYYYRFQALDQYSSIGRTKTLPVAGNEQVRFAQVCCAKLNAGFFNAYARIADRSDLDFVLHLGDYIYESAEPSLATKHEVPQLGRAYDPPGECKSLADYRARYSQYRLDPDLQRLHQALPMVATLDDHEIADGAWLDGSEAHDPLRDGSWSARRRDALTARWEWLPLRPPNLLDVEQVYQTIRVGDLLDLILVDARTRRDPPVAGPSVRAVHRTALGHSQAAWLCSELGSSRACWRAIGSPTLMATVRSDTLSVACREALRTLKLVNPQDDGPDLDPWSGYLHERESIMEFIRAQRLSNVVVLSGDVHVSLAAELTCEATTGDANVAVEIVTPSVTSQNLDDKMGWAPRTHSVPIEQSLLRARPSLRWCELDSHGYVIVDVTRERLLAQWWFVDAIDLPSAAERCAASWLVASGRSQLCFVGDGSESAAESRQ